MAQKEQKTPVAAKSDLDKSLLGYPHIEKLLENEDFSQVNASFSQAYQKLEKMLNDRSLGLKAQKKAQMALKAYELTVDLIKELLKVKYEMAKKKAEGAPDAKESKKKIEKKKL